MKNIYNDITCTSYNKTITIDINVCTSGEGYWNFIAGKIDETFYNHKNGALAVSYSDSSCFDQIISVVYSPLNICSKIFQEVGHYIQASYDGISGLSFEKYSDSECTYDIGSLISSVSINTCSNAFENLYYYYDSSSAYIMLSIVGLPTGYLYQSGCQIGLSAYTVTATGICYIIASGSQKYVYNYNTDQIQVNFYSDSICSFISESQIISMSPNCFRQRKGDPPGSIVNFNSAAFDISFFYQLSFQGAVAIGYESGSDCTGIITTVMYTPLNLCSKFQNNSIQATLNGTELTIIEYSDDACAIMITPLYDNVPLFSCHTNKNEITYGNSISNGDMLFTIVGLLIGPAGYVYNSQSCDGSSFAPVFATNYCFVSIIDGKGSEKYIYQNNEILKIMYSDSTCTTVFAKRFANINICSPGKNNWNFVAGSINETFYNHNNGAIAVTYHDSSCSEQITSVLYSPLNICSYGVSEIRYTYIQANFVNNILSFDKYYDSECTNKYGT